MSQSQISMVGTGRSAGAPSDAQVGGSEGLTDALVDPLRSSADIVQADGGDMSGSVHAVADQGLRSSSGPLPHLDTIQASFGAHDVSGVKAHTGPAAKDATASMGAGGFARGDHVALSDASDLHTAAHEAAHVVQQSAGVQLAGGVGKAGDAYERHADAVADAVVAGQSAEGLLSSMVGAPSCTAVGSGPVQMSLADPQVGEDFVFKIPFGKRAQMGNQSEAVGKITAVAATTVTLKVGSVTVRSVKVSDLIRVAPADAPAPSTASGTAEERPEPSEASDAAKDIVKEVKTEVAAAKASAGSAKPAKRRAKTSSSKGSASRGGAAKPAGPKTIAFTPRDSKGKKKELGRGEDGTFSQGVAPAFKDPGASLRERDALDTGSAAALVHGLPAEYFGSTAEGGKLMSAYQRVGPTGAYGRDMDKRGGGGLAVYTRAVGTEQEDWRSMGYGVGSNEARVQLVLDPKLLEDPDHAWRSSTMDNGGMAPSATKKDLMDVQKGKGGMDTYDLWSKQSEKGRNQAFNDTVRGGKLENNEQMHWESIPLEGVLKAVVATCQASFDTLMALEGATQSADDPTRGTVRVGETDVTVLLQDPNGPLLSALRGAGVLDQDNHII